MNATIQSELLTRAEAAAYLRIKPQTLGVWATTGRYGLRYTRIGSRVFYLKRDLDAFIERRSLSHAGQSLGT